MKQTQTKPIVGNDVDDILIEQTRSMMSRFDLTRNSSDVLMSTGKFRHKWMTDILDDVKNHPVKQIVIDAARRSEKTAGGSGDLCFLLTLALLSSASLSGDDRNAARTVQDDLREFSDHLLSCTKDLSWKTTCNFLGASGDEELANLLLSAVELAGCESSVEIVKSVSDEDSIELVAGFKFNYGYEHGFASLSSWTRNSCRVLLIDGVVESISEINTLLEQCSVSKTPVAILARGFAQDVMQTLSVNMMRKTLDVIPVVVPYDLEGANVLKDVATCCGTDIVSSLKGELISRRTLETLSSINKIRLDDRSTIIHAPTNSGIEILVDEIRKKKQEENVNIDVHPLLDKRIRSLSSKMITVNLANSSADRLRKSDLLLRRFLACASNGLLSIDVLETILAKIPDNMFSKTLRTFDDVSHYPLVSLLSALRYSESAVTALSNTGCMIFLET